MLHETFGEIIVDPKAIMHFIINLRGIIGFVVVVVLQKTLHLHNNQHYNMIVLYCSKKGMRYTIDSFVIVLLAFEIPSKVWF